MKRFVVLICVLSILLSVFTFFLGRYTKTEKENKIYPQTFKVVNIKNDIVTLENFEGYTFQFEGAEDWMIGDFCSCIMDSKNTDSIFDDEILEKRYSGFYEESN